MSISEKSDFFLLNNTFNVYYFNFIIAQVEMFDVAYVIRDAQVWH